MAGNLGGRVGEFAQGGDGVCNSTAGGVCCPLRKVAIAFFGQIFFKVFNGSFQGRPGNTLSIYLVDRLISELVIDVGEVTDDFITALGQIADRTAVHDFLPIYKIDV